MLSQPAKLLCIGSDTELLRTRCAILARFGYDAEHVIYDEAEKLLSAEQFDLIIVSAFLSDRQKHNLRAIIGEGTPTIMLQGLTFATDLLALVHHRLADASQLSEADGSTKPRPADPHFAL